MTINARGECDECGGTHYGSSVCPYDTEEAKRLDELRKALAERRNLEPVKETLPTMTIWGSVSKKRLGEMLAEALMSNRIVVIDGSDIRTIAGHKPNWR